MPVDGGAVELGELAGEDAERAAAVRVEPAVGAYERLWTAEARLARAALDASR